MSAPVVRREGLAYLGRVSQMSPLRVRLNDDIGDAPAWALDDFTSATIDTEVLVTIVEGRRFAARVA